MSTNWFSHLIRRSNSSKPWVAIRIFTLLELAEIKTKTERIFQPAPDRPTTTISMQDVILWMKTLDRITWFAAILLEHGASAGLTRNWMDWWSKLMPIAPKRICGKCGRIKSWRFDKAWEKSREINTQISYHAYTSTESRQCFFLCQIYDDEKSDVAPALEIRTL